MAVDMLLLVHGLPLNTVWSSIAGRVQLPKLFGFHTLEGIAQNRLPVELLRTEM